MDDITMEKKMQLVQQIRSQYNQNQYDMSNRERILYGRNSYQEEMSIINSNEQAMTEESLKLRSVLAVMLLLFAILFDFMGIKPAGIEMQQVFETIAADYKENMTIFVDAMTDENILE